MPTDTRRITCPETSRSPYDYCQIEISKEENQNELIKSDKKRKDGRLAAELRPIFLKANVISQARGSSYIEMGQTKVICAVYGPREVMRREDFSLKGQLTCDFKFTTFSCRQRRQHQQDNQEKDLSVQMLEALEPAVCLHKYPKSQINIYATVLQNDGSALSAAIMCASVALATAGIEMYDLVLASSLGVLNTVLLVDPTLQEEENIANETGKSPQNAGTMTLAFLPSLNQVSAMTSDGQFLFDMINKSMQQCIENCQKLYPVLQQCLVEDVKEKANLTHA
ncbi:exosome complex component MTR3 [Biomphalaria pfeifferi]|uniref:Exosome complex component MTR3 n=1 Tax=Biomphalaria pfeifferi TaxID=112525 RepID=A0AAD8EZJ3_BIOPF|nr:exosome complex component MTR3 [Biomphalaria pfeifferi]